MRFAGQLAGGKMELLKGERWVAEAARNVAALKEEAAGLKTLLAAGGRRAGRDLAERGARRFLEKG